MKDKAAFTSSGQEGHIHIKFHEPAFFSDMRRGNEKQTASVLQTKSDGSRNAVGIEVEDEDRAAFAKVRCNMELPARSSPSLSISPKPTEASKHNDIWHRSGMVSDETRVDNRSSARSPAKNLRRHTMAGIVRSSPERVDILDGGSPSEEEVLRRDGRREKTKKKMKIGVKWRRGNSSA